MDTILKRLKKEEKKIEFSKRYADIFKVASSQGGNSLPVTGSEEE